VNSEALKIADSALLNEEVYIECSDRRFYHGARSVEAISSLRPNAMFTQDLLAGVDYAFLRDRSIEVEQGKSLIRSLFCCELIEPIPLIGIKKMDWVNLCWNIVKADSDIPPYDGWLKNHLVSYLRLRYGEDIQGARLISGDKCRDTDEFIFEDAASVMRVNRIII